MEFLYVDATSGGILLQVLLSGFVGIAVVFKIFWHSILRTVFRRSDTDIEGDSPEPSDVVADSGHAR